MEKNASLLHEPKTVTINNFYILVLKSFGYCKPLQYEYCDMHICDIFITFLQP